MATVYEGTILTVDENDSVARFLVIEKGLVEYVGDELPLQYEKHARIDLGDDVLVPAFVDAQANLALCMMADDGVRVSDAASIAEVLEAVATGESASGREALMVFGASRFMLAEGRLPFRDELDGARSDKAVLLVSHDANECVANSKFIESMGQAAKDLEGFNEQTGLMTGQAAVAAFRHIREAISPGAMTAGLQKLVDSYASRGFGLINNACSMGLKGNFDVSFDRWFAKSLQNGIQMRLWPQAFRPTVSMRSKIYRIGGAFECALDGGFAQGKAALNEPYRNADGDRGELSYSFEDVEEFCFQSHNHKLIVAMRANGDAAFDQLARAHASTIDRSFKDVHRHGIIGASLPTEEGLDLCSKYAIHLVMMPDSIDRPQEPHSCLSELLGEERASKLNPLRTIWDKGIRISAGSNAPCVEADPIRWLHQACNHVVPEQSLTPREALRMCTINGAWITFDEDEYGSIEHGKVANLVRLSANPYEVPVQDLCKIKVKETILDGKPYKAQRQGFGSVVSKGLFCYGYC